MTNSDAFAPKADMLRTEAAVAALVGAITPVADHEMVALFDADRRVLAEDVIAKRTAPPLDNSAVDGYAVRTADLTDTETRLPVGGRVPAGQQLGRPIRAGETIRIFTGAPIPEGVDAVIPQENVRAEGDAAWLPKVKRGANVRPAGEDFREGEVLLSAGKRLLPQDCGQAAAAGHATLAVLRKPVVALFATGDEICEPGDARPDAIVNSNIYALKGLVQRLGCVPRYLGIIPDREAALKAELKRAAADGADLILTTGGVSVGEEDHVKAAVEALGELHFWRIAIKPGRPLAFGQVGQVPFIGLPGNPVAAWVTFLMFARPVLQKLAGTAPTAPQRFPVVADFDFRKKPGRREWLRATLTRDGDGRLVARRFANEGSGIFTSVVASTGLVELPEDLAEVRPGDAVDYLPFSDMLG